MKTKIEFTFKFEAVADEADFLVGLAGNQEGLSLEEAVKATEDELREEFTKDFPGIHKDKGIEIKNPEIIINVINICEHCGSKYGHCSCP